MRPNSATLLTALLLGAQLACGPSSDAVPPGVEHDVTPPSVATAPAAGDRATSDRAPLASQGPPRDLTARELQDRDAQLLATFSPCPERPITLKQCIDEAQPCAACVAAGDFVTRLVRQGVARSDREKLYSLRFDADKVVKIDIAGSPSRGPADAPVTLVEWSDFQCPHCAVMSIILGLVMERFPGQVRWVQKTYVLPMHASEPALAGAAAAKLGKYWEMHDKMFANQAALTPSDLSRYAVEAGMDRAAFEKQMKSAEARKRVEQDMQAADALGLDGTPMIYINGRNVPLESLTPFFEELLAWVGDELRMRGIAPLPPSARYEKLRQELGAQ